jgi:type II secretory pathway pseudopilin PulG
MTRTNDTNTNLPVVFRRRAQAFSLIELVGVLTIVVLLAAAATPTFVKRIDHETILAEEETLRKFSDALIRASKRDQVIATPSVWPTNIAAVLEFSPNLVRTNSRRFARAFLAHPDFAINGNALSAGSYVQNAAGTATMPVSARGMIASTIATGLPDLSGLTAAEFDNIWNTPKGTKPTTLSSWTGRGEDLAIERIEFTPLFHKVILSNVDTNKIGRYSINDVNAAWSTNTMQSVGATNSFTTHYMDGTILTLYRKEALLDTSEIVSSDISYLYKKDRWSRRLGGSDEVIGDFGELVSDFLNPPAPPDPKFAATQRAVINAFYDYLWGFSAWAYGDPTPSTNKSGVVTIPSVPPFAPTDGTSAPNYPSWARVDDAQVQLDVFTGNLIE